MKLQPKPLIISAVCGAAYGLFCQLASRQLVSRNVFDVMTIGYLFILPFAIGALTVYMAPPAKSRAWAWLQCFLLPWVSAGLSLLVAIAVGWEGLICLAISAVIALPLASLGGMAAFLMMKFIANRKARNLSMGLLLALPGGSAWMEGRMDLPVEFREVHTSIDIRAGEAKVWEHIARVKPITEPIGGFFYKMGFPKPIEATLSREGVGGVRHASFEGNLVFIETVDEWKLHDTLSFSIKADPAATPVTTLDEHVTVGGKYFDVLRGTYRMEKLGEETVRLHLSSRFRVSTRFNFYSNPWAEFLMRDIQESILDVIKRRCESHGLRA